MKKREKKQRKRGMNLGVLGCFFIGALSSTVLAEEPASPSQFWLQEKDYTAKAEALAAKKQESLPRVLLLGDSISMGYDQPVRKLLAGKATVVRPPVNCQSTELGLVRIEAWLGDKPWDLIHFNWGIWDAHHFKDNRFRTTAEEYEQNLRTLVSRLKKTGAKLIWASTTPLQGRIEQGGIWVEESEIPIRNAIASKVMKENGVLINDLHGEVLLHIGTLHSKDGCHFTADGYAFLGQRVAESVMKADKNNR
jgi:lysophospholipase L1-like esterase